MILSHSYDRRIINGAMGGQFAKAVADYLEQWDSSFTPQTLCYGIRITPPFMLLI